VSRALALGAVVAAALPAASAGADSFEPIVLRVSVAPVARLHKPLRIAVSVSADPGVLDVATAALRVRVKLAPECGGVFDGTPGPVLLDKRLNPQPRTGHAYIATASSSRGRPDAYGTRTVCVFLEEEGDNRQFATDTGTQVDVSRTCTAAASAYDRARKRYLRARRRHRGVRRERRAAASARRHALRACGRGVPL
jgi:hypothetical protein